jgi:hypothetical protein
MRKKLTGFLIRKGRHGEDTANQADTAQCGQSSSYHTNLPFDRIGLVEVPALEGKRLLAGCVFARRVLDAPAASP